MGRRGRGHPFPREENNFVRGWLTRTTTIGSTSRRPARKPRSSSSRPPPPPRFLSSTHSAHTAPPYHPKILHPILISDRGSFYLPPARSLAWMQEKKDRTALSRKRVGGAKGVPRAGGRVGCWRDGAARRVFFGAALALPQGNIFLSCK